MSSEHERIAEITRRLRDAGLRDGVRVDIGDDAAVVHAKGGDIVLSVDASVEGVHFESSWLSGSDLGFRALSTALSDLAAMGASPRCALVALTCPPELEDASLYSIIDGLAEGQAAYRCPVVGGNLSRARELTITTTVVGDSPTRPMLRNGARAGHGAYVTGELGAAAIGLRLLQSHREALAPACVARFRRPIARLHEAQAIAPHASACIDISDGLLQDLGHLCVASGVGCEVELARLPLPPSSPLTSDETLALALSGGEDYELLIAAEGAPSGCKLTRIGTFTATPGIRVVDAAGNQINHTQLEGFDHFRPKKSGPH